MRGLALLGVVLILLGIGGLAFEHFSYSQTDPVLKAGPIQVNKQEEHTISFPLAGSVVLIVAGVALVIAGRRKA